MNALTEALALAFIAACFFGVAVIMAVRIIGRDLRRERDDLRRERDSLVKERDSLRRESEGLKKDFVRANPAFRVNRPYGEGLGGQEPGGGNSTN
jgi:cell division protein FtsB